MLGDGERAIHCFERECSLQRRRQKVWEEAPFAGAGRRRCASRLCASAVALAEAVGYRGAGTSNISTTTRSGDFYFIEMNTRIQVEHPVTEMITGIDLVREMLRIAGGEPLAHPPGRTSPCAAMRSRCRINAEDPANGFMPAPGHRQRRSACPAGRGVRFDTHALSRAIPSRPSTIRCSAS